MNADFKEAVIAFAQTLDATWSTVEDARRSKQRLMDVIESKFDGSCFAIALKRIVEGCAKAEAL